MSSGSLSEGRFRQFYFEGINYRVEDNKTLVSDIGYCLERTDYGIQEFSKSMPWMRDLKLRLNESEVHSITSDSSLSYKIEVFDKTSKDFEKLRADYYKGISLLERAGLNN